MNEFAEVWQRIIDLQGQTFHQKTGVRTANQDGWIIRQWVRPFPALAGTTA
jgi:hypothetical protein